jgi:pimeloyl-ACP methyl ester carboxylesterase
MGRVSVGGFDLHVEETGVGPHLVIAHGMFGSVASSARNGVVGGEIAERGFHVVQYDARGHGRSGATVRRDDYCWEALAEELLGVMDALGLKQASVLGTSMGAGSCSALLAALSAPDRIERLVLRTPPAMGPDVRRVRRRLGAVKALYRWLGTTGATAVLSALGQAGAFAEQQAGVVPAAIEGMLFGRSELPERRMAEIRCPALILTHPGDPDHPLRSGEVLGRMPGATLCVAPCRGYWHTHPEVLTTLVASFLRGEPIEDCYGPPPVGELPPNNGLQQTPLSRSLGRRS